MSSKVINVLVIIKNWAIRIFFNNPVIPLINYSIAICTAAVCITIYFTVDYKDQVMQEEISKYEKKYEIAIAERDLLQRTKDQLEAKQEYDEKQFMEVQRQNERMLQYLAQIPNSEISIKKYFSNVEDKEINPQNFDKGPKKEDGKSLKDENGKYLYLSQATKSNKEVVRDRESGITVSVSSIDVYNKFNVKISSENNSDIDLYSQNVGSSKELVVNGVKYKVTVISVDYISELYKVEIKEL